MEPGPGAIEYARSLVAGMTRQEAAAKLREEPGGTDRRVKRCDYCRYLWRDKSLRNTKRTCSEECRTGIRTLQRSQQRADKALIGGEPRKKKQAEPKARYVWWLEYPFWLGSEYEWLNQAWKYEIPCGDAFMDSMHGKNHILGTGNRRKAHRQSGDNLV
jgi:hypothetical protein